MAKKQNPRPSAPVVASKDKKPIETQAKKQKPSKKNSEPVVEALAKETAAGNDEDLWEDESEAEVPSISRKQRRAGKANKMAVQADDESEDTDNGIATFDLQRLDESDSDSELDPEEAADDASDFEAEDDEEEDIDVDDLSMSGSEDEEIAATMRIRQTINNKEGLLAALRRISLNVLSPGVSFSFHQSLVSKTKTEDAITSIDDDLERELAFMNQSLEAARQARLLLKKEGVPFTRPTDYFAETLRSDEIMDKVKEKMVEEASAKKASAEARKLRDLKKFGKQVQVAKQQERAKQKRDTLDKIDLLKKKRKAGDNSTIGTAEVDDLFDVAVDKELKTAGKKRSAGDQGGPSNNNKRQKKESKFGFGGKKKHIKSGDAVSSGDVSGFSVKRMKSSTIGGRPGGKPGSKPGGRPGGGGKPGGKPRLGKSRRKVGGK
ncbi:eukaryotic rRNA processing protein EBP2-domain-containing protein [Lasiosphaeris hirsuta]|uniref:Eukaryotic rRNA processing protein EBP2-domain-containing protein n=1 Tax=Lasiosphaeris hirsuta TaxID=260670 RepID=A0AA40APX1_9PEZI|nr:eukaryotic rRNA processing protein EBP2-domain-containing protein [Lasiosphaeris hirsuta]